LQGGFFGTADFPEVGGIFDAALFLGRRAYQESGDGKQETGENRSVFQ
jgi:hypothetical protein